MGRIRYLRVQAQGFEVVWAPGNEKQGVTGCTVELVGREPGY